MVPLLATEVDLMTLITLCITLVTTLTGAAAAFGGGIWAAGTKICYFLWEKLSPIVTKHEAMITKINEEIPKVGAAIESQGKVISELAQTTNALKETQIQQFNRFDQQDEKIDAHGAKIDKIWLHLSDPDRKTPE